MIKEKPNATNLCPECFCMISFTSEDNKYNTMRIQEQAEFRKQDEAFRFKFRGTCSHCGPVYLERLIKNVKVKGE